MLANLWKLVLSLLPELEPITYLYIAILSLGVGLIQGVMGMAGGIVLAAVFSHIVGIKLAVPTITVALLFSNLSRTIIYARETEWKLASTVLLYGLPMVVLGTYVFVLVSPQLIALLFAFFLLVSIPLKNYALKRDLRTGPRLLAAVSVIWGFLTGNVIGAGFLLIPFLLGTGMNRLAFVGTFATIVFVMNTVRIATFWSFDAVEMEYIFLGGFVGLLLLPGNWFGRHVLKKLKDSEYRRLVDGLTICIAFNFLYLAIH